ncbi:Tfp pilus assembly protein FimT/FimU [Luteolibacter algae]|uniref:Tfp pilus assembly protein FimT/FimU n=1 Tax=Luteolibacter algae TaxID=454151 RepID=A0ABW5D4R4_9BACT
MISHPKIDRLQPGKHSPASSGGFTLLEIVIVLAITGLIIGGAITTVVLSSSERQLRDASGEIELLAKKARMAAILHQKPYAIEFHRNFVRVLPLAEASEIEQTTAQGNAIGGTAVTDDSSPSLHDEIDIDPDIELTVRHWNTTGFLAPSETSIIIWRFDPDGLSEPITVHLQLGESYAQDTYHPLTAAIADSELYAK